MLISSLLVLALAGSMVGSGCAITPDGEQGIVSIENMSELEYNNWVMYVQLGVKIPARRLLESGEITEDELELIASTLESVRDQTIVPGTTSILTPAFEDVGLNSDEIQLVVMIIENELLKRGALDWIDPDTGNIALSPRSRGLMTAVIDSLRSISLTEQELIYLEEEFLMER